MSEFFGRKTGSVLRPKLSDVKRGSVFCPKLSDVKRGSVFCPKVWTRKKKYIFFFSNFLSETFGQRRPNFRTKKVRNPKKSEDFGRKNASQLLHFRLLRTGLGSEQAPPNERARGLWPPPRQIPESLFSTPSPPGLGWSTGKQNWLALKPDKGVFL